MFASHTMKNKNINNHSDIYIQMRKEYKERKKKVVLKRKRKTDKKIVI